MGNAKYDFSLSTQESKSKKSFGLTWPNNSTNTTNNKYEI